MKFLFIFLVLNPFSLFLALNNDNFRDRAKSEEDLLFKLNMKLIKIKVDLEEILHNLREKNKINMELDTHKLFRDILLFSNRFI